MDMDAKRRPLILAKVLFERTDEEHYLTTAQLMEILEKEYGIKTQRQTIPSDIDMLCSFDMDILNEKLNNTTSHESNSGDSCRENHYPVGYYEILGYRVPAY